eukprot:9497506-Pyramimonas_sp.AAC.3
MQHGYRSAVVTFPAMAMCLERVSDWTFSFAIGSSRDYRLHGLTSTCCQFCNDLSTFATIDCGRAGDVYALLSLFATTRSRIT